MSDMGIDEAFLTGLEDDIARVIEAHDDFECHDRTTYRQAALNIAKAIGEKVSPELLRLRGEVERLTRERVEVDRIHREEFRVREMELSVETEGWQTERNCAREDQEAAEARADTLQAQLEKMRPQLIASAPLDGTHIDIFINGTRVSDVWWGRPDHSCGEAGRYCDSCPTYDGWCDMFGYITGTEGYEEDAPTHWALPLTVASLTEGETE